MLVSKVYALEDLFTKAIISFGEKLDAIYPDIDKKLSLYHLLCGKVFDGSMFDFLEKQNLLKQSFPQNNDRDYMIIGYENNEYCKKFNAKLFCSFNHARYKKSSLSSFGNADGHRFDYFRYFKLREKQRLYGKFLKVDESLKFYSNELIIEKSLDILKSILDKKPFEKNLFYENLLRFNYIDDNEIIVPVFYDYIEKCANFSEFVIDKIGKTLVKNMLEIKIEVLSLNIACIKHEIYADQLCNELWHIYFGLLNKFLIDKNFVARPQRFRGQGKYLKCIYL